MAICFVQQAVPHTLLDRQSMIRMASPCASWRFWPASSPLSLPLPRSWVGRCATRGNIREEQPHIARCHHPQPSQLEFYQESGLNAKIERTPDWCCPDGSASRTMTSSLILGQFGPTVYNKWEILIQNRKPQWTGLPCGASPSYHASWHINAILSYLT